LDKKCRFLFHYTYHPNKQALEVVQLVEVKLEGLTYRMKNSD
jgi:hypothetical protein